MTTESKQLTLDLATFLGIVLGMGLLIVAYFAPGMRILAAPALLILLPSLLYGMR